ncbi:crossover junction endodeoxyribonuclease RuvC [Nocardia neocaledoniensis]|uniref:crossover junction endodeoxyribonuclease RuvC n=1 Tax=Nocardia neocaledoniensis TaxID=236511 RepID=UPI002455DEBB|nr:crossover junction endodeoxyribonuclease RuvC [Nocardia neocaledoniensis]
MTIVVGIDPSLTGTGLAVLTSSGDRVDTALRTVGSTGKRSDTYAQRAARLVKLRNELMSHVPRKADLAVLEGPAYGVQGTGVHDRAWYWGKVYDALTSLGIPVAVCPPTTRAKWATDKGNSGKADVAVAVSRLWPVVEWRGDDQADALALASMGAQHIGMPVPYLVLERHKLAVAKIEWP